MPTCNKLFVVLHTSLQHKRGQVDEFTFYSASA